MISIRNIWTISRFEAKILWRNWFFRIFALVILFFLTMINFAAFSEVEDPRWRMIANSWGIPYVNMILLGIGQAAAIIFLATGVIKKDKKTDTNEVFYARAISNADFVFGKAFAVFKLFFVLNIIILCIGLVFNLTNSEAPFNPMAYVIYPLLSSMPSIIFTTGMAFLLVTLLRSQPVSIILLLGISAFNLIYFHEKFYNIFDYMAFRFSMMASDIAGFNNLNIILTQRSFYLVAGITLLFATSLFLDRLSNSKNIQIKTTLIVLVLTTLSAYLMMKLWNNYKGTRTFRENLVVTNGKWADVSNIQIKSNAIKLEHLGDEINASSDLVVSNNQPDPLSQIYFTLNPGLLVKEVKVNGSRSGFKRDLHIVSILMDEALVPGANATIQLSYAGTILDDVVSLDVDPIRYDRIDNHFVFSVHKQFAFLQQDYVLFTKDVLWYPDTQIGHSHILPVKDRDSFIRFQLDVKTQDENMAISQGQVTKNGEGFYQFRPEYPLPQISLTIGSYRSRKLEVDSVEFTLYHYRGNDYFSKYFDQVHDTLGSLVKDLINEYEHDQQLDYPFPRLQLVEVPIQFRAFNRIYEGHQAYIQPEMVLWPEKGGDISVFDFRRQMRIMEEQAREQNRVLSKKEIQANVFSDLVRRVFTKQIGRRFFFDGGDPDEPNYSLFPNLYAYNSGIVSKDWPLFNKSVSNYLNSDNPPTTDFSRNINGISFTEECNELMRRATLMEILTEEQEYNKIQKSVSLKGEYLFSYLGQIIGEKEFKEFLYNWVNQHSHQLTSYHDFRAGILDRFNLDIDPVIRRVYLDTDQPSFEISNIKEFEILDGDRKRYQILFDVRNSGTNDGVIKVNFYFWDDDVEFRFFGPGTEQELPDRPGYLSVIKTGETKQFGFVLDNPPDQFSINTLVSQNIPSVIDINPGKFEIKENMIPFEGEQITREGPVAKQYEVVVDNEDPGFSTFSPIKDTYLRKFLESRNPNDKKYYGSWRRSYSRWLATTGSDFYGDYIRSAHFTRSGKGEKITQWEPDLKESGFYDLYVFMMGKNQNQFISRNNENKNYTYQYLINHGDGSDEINFNLSNAEKGWNYLGSYYFTKGEGSVILTDKCDLRTVYADAIKWVKQ